ncbi:MAG: DUF1194 domain-containing protein [Pseudomonadota bacterium]
MRNAAFGLALTALPAQACDVALALTVDVSGSISPAEYDLQMLGLADALEDPTISDALVRGQVALILIQWTGSGRQVVSIPWTRVTDRAALQSFATQVRATGRAWRHFSTAIGDALLFTAAQFAQAPQCARQVIDVSGDGVSNEGTIVMQSRERVVALGVTINGLAIETSVENLTRYYDRFVIGGEGAFVLTALNYEDYPRAIRRKLLSEVVRPAS